MEKPYYKQDPSVRKFIEKLSKESPLADLLLNSSSYWLSNDRCLEILAEMGIRSLEDLKKYQTLEDFWSPRLKETVDRIVGRQERKKIEQITSLVMNCQYSTSLVRRSFHSAFVFNNMDNLLFAVIRAISFSLYGLTIQESYQYSNRFCGRELYLLLALWEDRQDITEFVRTAVTGDNTEALLDTDIIWAIVMSGHPALVDLLCSTLTAARLQEGLRQVILESADRGSLAVFIKIFQTCIDQNLFRYSSFVRAMGTWTGFSYENVSASHVKNYAMKAFRCLTEDEYRREAMESDNAMDAYFGLWAAGAHEASDCHRYVENLLTDSRKYRRILGWYFVSNLDHPLLQSEIAKNHLEERDDETLAWVTANLPVTSRADSCWGTEQDNPPKPNPVIFPGSIEERRDLFARLREIVLYIGNRKPAFHGTPFPFTQIQLENTRVIACMLSLAYYDFDRELILALADLVPYMNVDQKTAYYRKYCHADEWEEGKQIVRKGLEDRAVSVKEACVSILKTCSLENSEINSLGDALKTKSSSLRKAILQVLAAQETSAREQTALRLLKSANENLIQGGIELLLENKEDAKNSQAVQSALENLRGQKLSTQTRILLSQLTEEGEEARETYTPENGFGLYDRAALDEVMAPAPGQLAPERDILSFKDLKKYFAVSEKEFKALFDSLNQVFTENASYAYDTITYMGSKEKVILGSLGHFSLPLTQEAPFRFGSQRPGTVFSRTSNRFLYFPLADRFRQALGNCAERPADYVRLSLALIREPADQSRQNKDSLEPWFGRLYTPLCNPDADPLSSYGSPRCYQLRDVFRSYLPCHDPHAVFEEAFRIYRSLIACIGEENLGKAAKTARPLYSSQETKITAFNTALFTGVRQFINSLDLNAADKDVWLRYETRLEYFASPALTINAPLALEQYLERIDQGILPREWLAYVLLTEGYNRWISSFYTPANKPLLDSFPWLSDELQKIFSRIAQVEEMRGEQETELTHAACKIQRLYGAEHFVNLLAALGKENFFRGYYFFNNDTKQAVLSLLLKASRPRREDTAEKLKGLLKATDIRDSRLVEAAVYAPQWASLVEKVIGWKGLKKAVWFFHAHINERFSAEKETEVAVYSPISPTQFNDGAFDKNWFWDAYETLGEERFNQLYKAAKYITEGSNRHRRSQLYADAVRGKLNAEELKAEICEKRNQEKLRAYPLIPLGDKGKAEALERYEFLQKFLKESRQFGSSRRESEKKAVTTALENLAITMEYSDVNRMIWFLEGEKLEELKPLMKPFTEGDVTFWLEISDLGDPKIVFEKNGKLLKSAPASIKKHPHMTELKEALTQLKDQKSRAKKTLEAAMADGELFPGDELRKFADHLILWPLADKLVWIEETSGKIGFLIRNDNAICLEELDGTPTPISDSANYRLAHPHDLASKKLWPAYMQKLYTQEIVQPFKQVFREYYPITEDERESKTVSRRYAGYQVQPAKTVALLKGRGWTVDYEEGLQKVCYKENVIVRMYALADWFSPADIEPPTLEQIMFFDRNTGEPRAFDTISPVLFSEAMRDMDLAVSTAHAGGIDPEASLSTIEMRSAIAGELCRLMKLKNVRFSGSHAFIDGKLARYDVHLGSGVVHAEAKGMIAILPVHSQQRGRIFLPFADDDPKTAEIMSKIILLCDDQKIKDPNILRQLQGN